MNHQLEHDLVKVAFRRLCSLLGKNRAKTLSNAEPGDWILELEPKSQCYIVREFRSPKNFSSPFGENPMKGKEFVRAVWFAEECIQIWAKRQAE